MAQFEDYEVESLVRRQLKRAGFTVEGNLGIDEIGSRYMTDEGIEQFVDWLKLHRLKIVRE